MSEDVSVEFGAQTGEATAAITELREILFGLAEPIRGMRANLGELAEAFVAAFAVEKIAEFVERMTEMGAAVAHASIELGISAEEISKFQYAAGAMGVSVDSSTMALGRLERNMAQAKDGTGPTAMAFQALGISVTNSRGHLRDLSDVLGDVADKFQKTADGPDKAAITLALFGRAGLQMLPVLDQGREGLQKFNLEMKATGTEITGPMAEAMEENSLALHELHQAWEGLSITLYTAFMPAIKESADAMSHMIESMNDGVRASSGLTMTFNTIIAIFRLFADVCGIVVNMIGLVGDAIKALDAVTLPAAKAFMALGLAMTGHFSEAKAEWDSIPKDTAAAWDTAFKSIKTHWDAITRDMIESGKLLAGQLPGGEHGPKPDEHGEHKPALDYDPNAARKAAELKRQQQEELRNFLALKNAELELNRNNFDQQMVIEDEKLAAIAKLYGEDSHQYQTELRNKERMQREHAQILQKIEIDAANTRGQIAIMDIENKKEMLAEQVAMGNITKKEEIAQLIDFTNQEYAIKLQELQNELKLQDLSLQQQARINNQIIMLKQQQKNAIEKLNLETVLTTEKQWMQWGQMVGRSFSQAIQGMLSGTMNFKQAVGSIFQSLFGAIIDELAKMAVEWATKEAMRLIIHEGTNAAIIADDVSTDAAGLAAQVATAETTIMSEAAEASAGAYASAAAIPIIGWVIAPGVAAEAYASVAAMGGLAAAAGGWEVDADQLAMVHKNEMVLPSKLSDGIRQMVSGGGAGSASGAGGAPGGGAPAVNVTFQVHAMDAASVSNLFRNNGRAIAYSVASQVRNQNTTLTKALKGAGG